MATMSYASTTDSTIKSKHRAKRSAACRAKDLLFIQTHILQGRSQIEIAELLAAERVYWVSRSQISFDIAKLKRLWIAASVESFAEARATELRRRVL